MAEAAEGGGSDIVIDDTPVVSDPSPISVYDLEGEWALIGFGIFDADTNDLLMTDADTDFTVGDMLIDAQSATTGIISQAFTVRIGGITETPSVSGTITGMTRNYTSADNQSYGLMSWTDYTQTPPTYGSFDYIYQHSTGQLNTGTEVIGTGLYELDQWVPAGSS